MQEVSSFSFPITTLIHTPAPLANLEGNFIAVIFRCLPLPHGLCPKTQRFPWYLVYEGLASGPWHFHSRGLLKPQGHQWRLEIPCSGLASWNAPHACPPGASALPQEPELCKGPFLGAGRSPFPFYTGGRTEGKVSFSHCLPHSLLLPL